MLSSHRLERYSHTPAAPTAPAPARPNVCSAPCRRPELSREPPRRGARRKGLAVLAHALGRPAVVRRGGAILGLCSRAAVGLSGERRAEGFALPPAPGFRRGRRPAMESEYYSGDQSGSGAGGTLRPEGRDGWVRPALRCSAAAAALGQRAAAPVGTAGPLRASACGVLGRVGSRRVRALRASCFVPGRFVALCAPGSLSEPCPCVTARLCPGPTAGPAEPSAPGTC